MKVLLLDSLLALTLGAQLATGTRIGWLDASIGVNINRAKSDSKSNDERMA